MLVCLQTEIIFALMNYLVKLELGGHMAEGLLKITIPAEESSDVSSESLIAAGTSLEGVIESKQSFTLMGMLKGRISTTNMVTVAKEGILNGEVACGFLDLIGTCDARAQVDSKATLQSGAKLNGDLTCHVLQVESGASIQGHVRTQKYR